MDEDAGGVEHRGQGGRRAGDELGDEGGDHLGDGDPAGAGGGLHLVHERLDRRLVEVLTCGDDVRQGEETVRARNGPSRIGFDHGPLLGAGSPVVPRQ